jgi:hypothetical protein
MVMGWHHVVQALLPMVAVLGPGCCCCFAQDPSKAPLPEGLVARQTVAGPPLGAGVADAFSTFVQFQVPFGRFTGCSCFEGGGPALPGPP